jgi:hypothetical protein
MVERSLNSSGLRLIWKASKLVKYALEVNPNLTADERADLEIALAKLSKFHAYPRIRF